MDNRDALVAIWKGIRSVDVGVLCVSSDVAEIRASCHFDRTTGAVERSGFHTGERVSHATAHKRDLDDGSLDNLRRSGGRVGYVSAENISSG